LELLLVEPGLEQPLAPFPLGAAGADRAHVERVARERPRQRGHVEPLLPGEDDDGRVPVGPPPLPPRGPPVLGAPPRPPPGATTAVGQPSALAARQSSSAVSMAPTTSSRSGGPSTSANTRSPSSSSTRLGPGGTSPSTARRRWPMRSPSSTVSVTEGSSGSSP